MNEYDFTWLLVVTVVVTCGVASEKFGFQVVRFVLECDGTEFDNEEELMAFCDGSTILMGLRDNEEWTGSSAPAQVAGQATVSVSNDQSMAPPATSRGM